MEADNFTLEYSNYTFELDEMVCFKVLKNNNDITFFDHYYENCNYEIKDANTTYIEYILTDCIDEFSLEIYRLNGNNEEAFVTDIDDGCGLNSFIYF